MTANATLAVDDLKRRQAVQVTLFLLAVAADEHVWAGL